MSAARPERRPARVFTVNRHELPENARFIVGGIRANPRYAPFAPLRIAYAACRASPAGRPGSVLHRRRFGDAFDVDGNNFGGWAGCDRWSAGRAPGMGAVARDFQPHWLWRHSILSHRQHRSARDRGDLHVGPADVIWVVNVYQIALVATLLPLAALGEIVGHRRIYLGGLLLFRWLRWAAPWPVIAQPAGRAACCRGSAPAAS